MFFSGVPPDAPATDTQEDQLWCVSDQAVGFRAVNTAAGIEYQPTPVNNQHSELVVRWLTELEFERAHMMGAFGRLGVFESPGGYPIGGCDTRDYTAPINFLEPLTCRPVNYLGAVFGVHNAHYQAFYPGGSLYPTGMVDDGPTVEMGHCSVKKVDVPAADEPPPAPRK